MNKTWGIVGALLFVAAVIVGYFVDFPASDIISIALAAFGLATVIIASCKNAKNKGKFGVKTIIVIVLACISGVLVCVGGLSQNIFAELSGAALALLTIIFAIDYNKK